jgi:folate-binding Fe-S cluster repair protein YgfZ
MLNLDKLNAISFTKGCYVGQEIVARSQYLGEVKRRLSLLHGTGTPPQPGDRVYSQTLAQEHIVGDIVRTAAAPGGEFVALAVINNDAARHLLLDGDLPVTRS